MAYEGPGKSPIDYQHYRLKKSRLLFRGPNRKIKKASVAFVGGTETYGKFVEQSFVEMVETVVKSPCLNFGAVNAGVDVFMNDEGVIDACGRASCVVVQILGAHNMSNRFYSVHPRRNDRFLGASMLLKTIYREVDFTEFAFTRHMLGTLKKVSPEKFATVELELKTAWAARMELFLSRIKAREKMLLWVSDGFSDNANMGATIGGEPLFIDRSMVDGLRPFVDDIIEVPVPVSTARCTEGMKFLPMEEAAAVQTIGPDVHALISEHVCAALKKKKPTH